jgi:protein TonB
MSRGMPYSIIIHILTLGLVLLYGNSVQRQEIRPPHSIRVRMVELPRAPEVKTETPVETPAEQPKPAPPTETVVETPPKEVPEPRPEPEKKPEVKKEPEPVKQETPVEQPARAEEPPAEETAAEVPTVTGPAVQGTDVDFPFAWYLAQVQGQIARNWDPRQGNFRSRSVVFCVVHFTINKNGTVSRITITQSSGVGVFDREAQRAVQSSRMPPLPPGFASPTLGVSMKFNLESGI